MQTPAVAPSVIENYVGGSWRRSAASETLAVMNPATAAELGRVPLSPAAEIEEAVEAAAKAFPAWRRTPVLDRVQYLFKLKALLEDHFEEISRIVTMECGKTLAESRGEMRRALENVEMACAAPAMTQGYNSEDIASGIDEIMIRQPLGVCAIISPFNFPSMIPFWFMPYATGLRQHGDREAVRAGAADHAENFSTGGDAGAPAGRVEPGERRTRCGQRHSGFEDRACGKLRRIRAPRRGTCTRGPPPRASGRSARAERRIR